MSDTAVLDKETSADEATSANSRRPAALVKYGWCSAAYYPTERARKSDGEVFTAHDISVRVSWKGDDGKTHHRELTVPRTEAFNLAEAITDVTKQSYELSRQQHASDEA